MRMSSGASKCVCVLVTASLSAVLCDSTLAEDGLTRPSANTAATVESETGAVSDSSDAVETWLQGTLPRPGHSISAGQRLQSNGQTASRRALPAGRDSRASIWQMTWPLLVVLAVIAGGAMGLRRVFPRTNRLGGGGVINLLASHYLSGRQSLCLVRLGRRAILLGVTPERIAPVAEISDAAELADLVAAVERRRPNSFSSTFARFCAGKHGERLAENADEAGSVISTERLAKAGGSVRDLVGRIRSLSQREESAEPT